MRSCPFCRNRGSNLKVVVDTPQGISGSVLTYYYVECGNCLARGPRISNWMSDTRGREKTILTEKAIEIWNSLEDEDD